MAYDTLTIIIPAINEEETINEVITKCRVYSDDIIVIDGHSTDKTKEVAKRAGATVYEDQKKGKGDAIRLGIAKAEREILVFIDADGSHDPEDIPKLITPILDGRADHVIASRMKGGSDELHGDIGKFIRVTGSHVITMGINYRFGVRLTDSQNGFRAIKRSVALALGLKEDVTSIEEEMLIKTLKKRYRVAEVPSHEYARKSGLPKLNVRKVWLRHVYVWLKHLFF